tara:strand:+ start:253 stop:567 length:315 start_codon:yes stop_codon:yes gene_type:complete
MEVRVSEEIYTEDELDIIHDAHAHETRMGPLANVFEVIREKIPRLSSNSIRRAIWDLNNLGFVDMPRHPSVKRSCMSCSRIFVSEGPQNRLCSTCKTRAGSSIE